LAAAFWKVSHGHDGNRLLDSQQRASPPPRQTSQSPTRTTTTRAREWAPS
jgi:hypothetical protein